MMRCKQQQATHYGPHQPGAPHWSATAKPCTILVRGFFYARASRSLRSLGSVRCGSVGCGECCRACCAPLRLRRSICAAHAARSIMHALLPQCRRRRRPCLPSLPPAPPALPTSTGAAARCRAGAAPATVLIASALHQCVRPVRTVRCVRPAATVVYCTNCANCAFRKYPPPPPARDGHGIQPTAYGIYRGCIACELFSTLFTP